MKMLFITIISFAIFASQVESNNRTTERRLMNDGNWIPATGCGTCVVKLDDCKCVAEALTWAIEAGYRHIDTAALYLTEDAVGEAIKNVTSRRIVRRTDMFITSKLPLSVSTREQVIPAIEEALVRLQLEYVDLYLIHTPHNVLKKKDYDFLEIWKGLEDAKHRGLTRSIGVSNFNQTEIKRILDNSKTIPAVNQIETNPTYTNLELVTYCQKKNIIVTGYAPFGFLVPRPFIDLKIPPTFDDPILVEMAKEYCVDVSQIMLRYLVDRRIIPITSSLDKDHIALNINIFDFTLSKEYILKINGFNKNVKVYFGAEDGFVQGLRYDYRYIKRYVEKNNLEQYKNI